MGQEELFPGIRFSTPGPGQLPASPFNVHLPTRSPLRTVISPPSPPHLLPLGFCSQSLLPLSLPERHFFKLCSATEGAISLSVAFIDSFRMQKTSVILNLAPSQPAKSPHPPLPFSKLCPGLGIPSPSLFICMPRVLVISHPSGQPSPHPFLSSCPHLSL